MKSPRLLIAAALLSAASANAALIGYWNCNETSGTVADTSAFGTAMNFDTVSGTASNLLYGQSTLGNGTYGAITVTNAAAFGTALSANGTANIYDASNAADKIDSLNNNITVMLWFKAAGLSGMQRLFSGPLGSGTAIWGLGLSGSNLIFTKGGVADITTSNATGLTTGSWHHLAVSVSSTTGTSFYLDGNLLQTIADTSNMLTGRTGGLGIFGGASAANERFNGALDEVRVYNTVLDVNQIRTEAINVSAVPEPRDYGLMGAGALAVAAFVRRRRLTQA